MPFPPHFIWGAASASYQIEGGARADGRGRSIWDAMCERPGVIYRGQTGDVSTDHYYRYREDVAIMKQIGLRGYRFSIGWPRILPCGTGEVNAAGVAFYDRLVDELLAAGITPHVTLFHWDYPLDLYHRGGWLNADSSDWFADYVSVVVRALSDRVSTWFTINEPQCIIGLGLLSGELAPGDKLPMPLVTRAAHNLLLGHGKAVQAIRANSKQPALVGLAPAGAGRHPATESPADIKAAREAFFSVFETRFWDNTWFTDPIFFRQYPEDGMALFRAMGAEPRIGTHDMNIIAQPVDFLAVNFYNSEAVRASALGDDTGWEFVPYVPGDPALTSESSNCQPAIMYWGPKWLAERYNKPIYITENGAHAYEWIHVDGQVHDPYRIDFMTRYLRELERAVTEGVDVRGYFYWSILDSMEWTAGYAPRMGLVYVDYPTQRRIQKDSARWYAEVIASNGLHLWG